jgi:hypothetical protein
VTVDVRYPDQAPNGLVSMLGGLIEANLMAHPERGALLGRTATYSITAPDAGVSASLRLSPGVVAVRNGIVGKPDIRIESNSDDLLALSALPLRLGLPDLMTKEGRAVTRKLMKRELRVRGLILHPGKLARRNKLLSVV